MKLMSIFNGDLNGEKFFEAQIFHGCHGNLPSDESDSTYGGESCDFVPQSVHKYRETLLQLSLESISHGSNHLTPAQIM